jgi:hypothetical protein
MEEPVAMQEKARGMGVCAHRQQSANEKSGLTAAHSRARKFFAG